MIRGDDMKNSFALHNPNLVSEWSDNNLPLTPENISFGSNKLYWWKGFCGYKWQANAKSRSSGEMCPICSGKRVVVGINDLASQYPLLADEWSDKNAFKPTEVTAGSSKRVVWNGKCGHEWSAVIKNRVHGSACPYCSHNIVLKGYNDLATLYPKVAREWSKRNASLKANMVTAFSNKKVWWKCKFGHEWEARISDRTHGSRCPYCSGTIHLEGFNDLATTHPHLALEWSERNGSIAPNQINSKSRRSVWWKCNKCSCEWKAVISARVNGALCPVCSGRKALLGYNDLETTDPDLMQEWDFEKNIALPTTITRFSRAIVWWKCKCDHSYKAKISEKAITNNICPICEKEYQTVFPQLVILYYGKLAGRKVIINDTGLLGINVETYLPEESIVIESKCEPNRISRIKKHLCNKRNIEYYLMPYIATENEIQYANRIKDMFKSVNLFLSTDTNSDIAIIRKEFFEWKNAKI